MTLQEVLERVAEGSLAADEAQRYFDGYGLVEVGHSKLDLHRAGRTCAPEVVYGRDKSVPQLREILGFAVEQGLRLLVTKVSREKGEELCSHFEQAHFDCASGLLELPFGEPEQLAGSVAVVSAGTSDYPIAEEAAGTLRFFGIATSRVYDCGVAGLHRLFAHGDTITSSDVIIAVAGMDGALPSVIAGAFRQPVIAVPTSVGYGASFEGLSALLTMMSSCAPGITVVNIDNGFGAAVAAKSMLSMAARMAGRAALARKEEL